jgi:hypothetical protein
MYVGSSRARRLHVLSESKIRWEPSGDNGLPGVGWSDVENEGLILSPCTLDVENHLKRTP